MSRIRRSTSVRRAIWETFNRTCQMCFQPTDERGFDLDHHIPLRAGGEDTIENLRPLCRPCHRLKTADDQATIKKTRRLEDKATGVTAQPRQKIQSRGFAPAPPQQRARRPVNKTMPPRAPMFE